jgi:hypothetical protein
MSFIARHWQQDHVLSRRRDLLEWQHGAGERLAYLGAWDGDALLAVLGYISTQRFDPALAGGDNVLWLALWKLRDDIKAPGLGLRLLTMLSNIESNGAIGVIGINPDHLAMYRTMRYCTGNMTQYVVFHPQQPPRLAVVPPGKARPLPCPGRANLVEITTASPPLNLHLGERAEQVPRKSQAYFESRYLRHPFYSYRVFSLELDGKATGLLATRLAAHDGVRALRIVDWYGNPAALAQSGTAIEGLLRESDAEYADLWQFGIPAERLGGAGFAAVEVEGDLIVPTLFEPFVQANKRLQFAFREKNNQPFVIMRADGDQDRPNMRETS